MRISDWSSDVCSSDLHARHVVKPRIDARWSRSYQDQPLAGDGVVADMKRSRCVARHVLTAVASFAVLCNGSVGSAQSLGGAIDPGVIDQLQRQLGSGSTSSTALDSARQSGDAQNAGAQEQGELFQRPEKTAEELELQRQQALRQLDEIYIPSAIEREYQTRLEDSTLRQFGYELFRSASSISRSEEHTSELQSLMR